jgi:mono/diheme cytochrome c family protein
MRCLWMIAIGFGLLLGMKPAAIAREDPTTGLVVAPGWEVVRAHCGTCHSFQLVTSQRSGTAFWSGTIRWMQRTQNLWQIPPDQHQAIVGYLATHYAETDRGRRPQFPPTLTP